MAKDYKQAVSSASKNSNQTTERIDIGRSAKIGDSKIFLDHVNARLIVNDGTRDRIVIGLNSSSDYGIEMYNEDGDKIIDMSGSNAKLTSSDGNTYFDLNDDVLIVNDGTRDRVKIGKIGTTYGIELVNDDGATVLDFDGANAKISSDDGKTYFDLNNDKIVVNDGSHDRLIIGKF